MTFSRFLRTVFEVHRMPNLDAQIDFEQNWADPSHYTIGQNLHPASEMDPASGDSSGAPYDGAALPGGAGGMPPGGGMPPDPAAGGMPPPDDQLQPIQPGMEQPPGPGQPPVQESAMKKDDYDLFLDSLLDESEEIAEGPFEMTYGGFNTPQRPPASIEAGGPLAVQNWQRQAAAVSPSMPNPYRAGVGYAPPEYDSGGRAMGRYAGGGGGGGGPARPTAPARPAGGSYGGGGDAPRGGRGPAAPAGPARAGSSAPPPIPGPFGPPDNIGRGEYGVGQIAPHPGAQAPGGNDAEPRPKERSLWDRVTAPFGTVIGGDKIPKAGTPAAAATTGADTPMADPMSGVYYDKRWRDPMTDNNITSNNPLLGHPPAPPIPGPAPAGGFPPPIPGPAPAGGFPAKPAAPAAPGLARVTSGDKPTMPNPAAAQQPPAAQDWVTRPATPPPAQPPAGAGAGTSAPPAAGGGAVSAPTGAAYGGNSGGNKEIMSSKDWGLNWADYNILHEGDRQRDKRIRGY